MTRLLIILVLSLAFLTILYLSDFYLSNLIRRTVDRVNSEAQKGNGAKPITFLRASLLSIVFWVIPLLAYPETMKLEYKIFLTIAYWSLTGYFLFASLKKRLPRKHSIQAFSLLIIAALSSAILWVPLITLITDMQ